MSEGYLREMKSQKFGIEIEFSFITREEAKGKTEAEQVLQERLRRIDL